jgi:hypothetical protein
MRKKEIIKKGSKYNRLTIIKELEFENRPPRKFVCVCDCGTEREISLRNLKNGHTKSCGCHRNEVASKLNLKHGLRSSLEYESYSGAKSRCTNKSNPKYKNYGSRGIKFLIPSITDLIKAIGRKPSPQHSLDRIDNNGNYEVGNIRWATPKEQQRNRRNNIIFNGEYAIDVNKKLGGNNDLIQDRIRRGWSFKKAFTTPLSAVVENLKGV